MDTAYLKKAVGDQLAKGIAHVCEVLPSDPVEYLALWLLHEIQQEEVKARRQIESDELERLRKEVEKEQLIKQDAAAKVIQSEMKNFLQKREEQKRKQQEEEEQLRIQEEELRRRKFPKVYNYYRIGRRIANTCS
jgi:Skp family chaperone for outer membrane proteins